MPASLPHSYRSSSGVYYFRFVWPKPIQDAFSELGRDFRCSLNTKSREVAKYKILSRLSYLNKIVEFVSFNKYNSERGVEYGLFCFLFGGDNSTRYLSNIWNEIQCSGLKLKGRINMMLNYMEHRHPDGGVTIFDGNKDVEVDRLARLLAAQKYYEQIYAQQLAATSTDTSARPPQALSNSVETAVPQPVARDLPTAEPVVQPSVNQSVVDEASCDTHDTDSMTFSELVEDYLETKVLEGELSQDSGTYIKYRGVFKCLSELVGADTKINQLTVQDAVRVKKGLLNYPSRRFLGRNAAKSLEQLLNETNVKTIDRKTAAENFRLFKSVIDLAFSNGYIKADFAKTINIKNKKKAKVTYSEQVGEKGIELSLNKEGERTSFSNTDLTKLLQGYLYHGSNDYAGRKRTFLPAHYWIPLITMYMGFRINEVSQLLVSDIGEGPVVSLGHTYDGAYFKIIAGDDTQQLKNENAHRLVPVHRKLVEIGFLEFVAQRRKETQGNSKAVLFEGVFYQLNSRWGRLIGRWFNGDDRKSGYLYSVFGDQRGARAFHSFRHTVTDMLRDQNVEEAKIAAIVGHEHGTSTAYYGQGYSLNVLQGYVDSICYSDDVEALVSSLDYKKFLRFAKSIRPRPKGETKRGAQAA